STIANNNNDAAGLSQTRRGGGFYGRERSVSVIVNSTFYENTGGNGAGISLYGTAAAPSRMDIINSTVTRNNGLTNGGRIEDTANTTMDVHNSIVSGMTAPNRPVVFEGGTG